MMVPNEFDTFPKATATLPLTTPTSVAPVPTVIPGVPIFQDLHDTGKRTLWYGHHSKDKHHSMTI